MIDEGLKFTLSTMCPPASIIELMEGIKLKIPVIAMDGGVLYDVQQKRYLEKIEIQEKDTANIAKLLDEADMIDLLKRRLNSERIITFGTIPGKYDYVVETGNTNEVVHKMKKIFEPIF